LTAAPPSTLRLGTRRSPLALAQSRLVARALEAAHPGLTVELVPRVTTGDLLPGDLTQHGGKGLFTRELEEGLLDGTLDLAVHSLKDLPAALPAGLLVAAYPERADPRDVLVSAVAAAIDELPAGSVVLTGSLRRRAQLLARRPDLAVEPVRGNIETRIRKWRETRAAAVVLAAAGLDRLGLAELPAHPIPPEAMLPAPGQGTLAVEVRQGGQAEERCRALDHPPTARAAAAERAVVTAFGGDCTLPLAAWAREEPDGELRLDAVIASPNGRRLVRGAGSGDEAAAACIAALRAAGAEALLAELTR